MFAIEEEGTLVAMIGLQQKADGRFFGRRLYVDPEHRGKGFGGILFGKMLDEAKNLGAKKLYLGVTEGISALKMYTSMGFNEIGRHKDEMRGDGKLRDEILMEKEL